MNKEVLKNIGITLLCFCFIFSAASVFSESPESIEIVEGNSKSINMDFVIIKVATGDSDICNAIKVNDHELLINAKRAGATNVIVWGSGDKKHEIAVNITRPDIAAYVNEIKKLLANIEGISVKASGQRVAVEGEVFTTNDFDKVNKVLENMPDVLNLVEVSPVMRNLIAVEIKKAIGVEEITVKAGKKKFILGGKADSEDAVQRAVNIALAYSPDIINTIEIDKTMTNEKAEEIEKAIGIRGVTVKAGRNKLILEGTVSNKETSVRAENIALAYSPDIVNAIEINSTKTQAKAVMIEMTMTIMELDKSVLNDFGVNWNVGGTLGGGGSLSGGTDQKSSLVGRLTGTISDLFPKIKKIQEDGRGRSLMQQSVITKSGENANFFVGSEIPIPVAQVGGITTIEYKSVGVTLDISPTIDFYRNINAIIKIESSSIPGNLGGTPEIRSTKLKTEINIPNNTSIALGGVIGQRELMNYSNSVPGSTTVPLINKGELLNNEQKEVIVFITPRVLAGPEEAVEDIRDKVEDSFKEYELEKIEQ